MIYWAITPIKLSLSLRQEWRLVDAPSLPSFEEDYLGHFPSSRLADFSAFPIRPENEELSKGEVFSKAWTYQQNLFALTVLVVIIQKLRLYLGFFGFYINCGESSLYRMGLGWRRTKRSWDRHRSINWRLWRSWVTGSNTRSLENV